VNLIYDRYPDTVMLNGKRREIVTDFKDWLKFVDLLKDDEFSPEEKFESILLFYCDPVPIKDQANACKPLIDFFKMTEAEDKSYQADYEEEEETENIKPLYDFRYDARCIIAGFWHDYQIDLTKAHMHWWKFRILLDGLSSETEFKQRVMYRNTDTSRIKDVEERNRILRIQRKIAIPQPVPSDDEIGGMFW
jgi:hypothetical protein